MHRRIAVQGSGGVTATIVVFVRQGTVLMSIMPPFTWEAIMDPETVDELIRTLELAQADARKTPLTREPPMILGGKVEIYPCAKPAGLAVDIQPGQRLDLGR